MGSRASTLPVWLLVLTVVYVALLSLPGPPQATGTGLDASWMLGLNLAHAHGMVAGWDIVFTYGPLGYLLYPQPVSGAPVAALLFRLGLYLLFLAALCRLMRLMQSRLAALWTALIFGLSVALDALPHETIVILPITALALVVLVDRSRWRYAELSLLGVMASFGCLVKLDQGIEGIALFLILAATVTLQEPLTRLAQRRIVLVICTLPVSIVILFLLSTGNIGGLIAYGRTGWGIVTGYSEAMGLPGPLWQVSLACATVAMTFLVVLAAADLRSLWPGLAPAVAVSWFVFKHAMVRQDAGHAPSFHIKFALGLLFLLVCAGAVRDRRLIAILQLFSVAMAGAISVESYTGFGADIRARLLLQRADSSLAAYGHWPATWTRVGIADEHNRSKLRLPDAVRRIVGNATVDAIPWDVDVVEANGWDWRPRPVFQSYSAYTPALDELDAAHLEGTRTADFALLSFETIDNRHPFLETPLSWRALADRYDLKLATPDWFLLQHRPDARYAPLVPLQSAVIHWDQDVLVPQADGLLTMAPRLELSLAGRLISFLFRPAAVYAEVTYHSGKTLRWRSVPDNLAAGFLIRPFPQSLEDLRGIFSREPALSFAGDVVSIRFHTDKPGEFAADIPVAWSRLPVQAGATPAAPQSPFPPASLTPLWLPKDRAPRPSNAQVQVRRNWIEVTPSAEDPQLLFDIGPALGRFRTLVVRGWFQKADRIDAFFGRQVEGRGVNGILPAAGQWLDVYLDMSHNLFWEEEHGTTLRFDPVPSAGQGTTAYIAGIWGSTEAVPAAAPDVEFYPVPPAQAPPAPEKKGH